MESVLYIDDAPALPEGTARELRRLGLRLIHAEDPQEGLRLAREQRPRMVLLEVLLPGCDGWQLLRELVACGEAQGELPIVILTRGERSPELYAPAVELGVVDFLSKPVLRAELLAAVLECTETRRPPPPETRVAAHPREAREAPVRGDLSSSPLPVVLLELRRLGATGVLVLQFETETRVIQFRNGSPVGAGSNRGRESLEDFLVRTKRISGEEHAVICGQSRAGGGSTSEILVDLGVLRPEELREAQLQRAAEPLLECLEWTAGSFRFLPRKRFESERILDFDSSPERLLLDGALHWLPSTSVRAVLDPRADLYASKVTLPSASSVEGALLDDACNRLHRLAGDRTVAELLDSGEIPARALCGLLMAGLVELSPEPALVLNQVVDPVAASPPAGPAASERQASAPLGGLPGRSAPAGAPSGSSDLAAPPGGEDPEAARRLEAESWFRRGEGALAIRRADRALEAFGMAAHLDPGQGEYHAHLGYALHLHQPRNALVRREALEHIAKGIQLSPEQWKPLVFLARVFRAAGERDNARKVLGRALKLDPDCAAARAELRLLGVLDRTPRAGPIDRLRSWLGRRLGP